LSGENGTNFQAVENASAGDPLPDICSAKNWEDGVMDQSRQLPQLLPALDVYDYVRSWMRRADSTQYTVIRTPLSLTISVQSNSPSPAGSGPENGDISNTSKVLLDVRLQEIRITALERESARQAVQLDRIVAVLEMITARANPGLAGQCYTSSVPPTGVSHTSESARTEDMPGDGRPAGR